MTIEAKDKLIEDMEVGKLMAEIFLSFL